MTDYPSWKVAERQCAKILSGYYNHAQRAGVESGGDLLYLGDVIASSDDTKVLLAQVKDFQQLQDAPFRSHRSSAIKKVNGEHVRYEVWQRGDDDWKVYPIPLKDDSHLYVMEPTYVSLPLEAKPARDRYVEYRNGNVDMEVHE